MAEERDRVYEELREKLDRMGFGYSATESGAEYTFLERFFTPEQARWVVDLPFDQYVTAEQAAPLMGVGLEEAETMLLELSREGLIYRRRDEDGAARYHLVPFAHGIYEFHVDRVENEWSQAMGRHYMQGWGKSFYGSSDTPIFRTMPIADAVSADDDFPAQEDVRRLIGDRTRIAVAPCMCRLREQEGGRGCEHEMEACLSFDDFADFYVENGLARAISAEEALTIVDKCVKEGCVLSVANSKHPEALCCCCSDACGLLGAIKYFPGPAVDNVSNYRCERDAEKCLEPKCRHICAKRCPVGAFRSKDGDLTFRPEQCIGCGLCVLTCPGKALTLHRKPNEEIYEPNETLFDTYTVISEQRGVA